MINYHEILKELVILRNQDKISSQTFRSLVGQAKNDITSVKNFLRNILVLDMLWEDKFKI